MVVHHRSNDGMVMYHRWSLGRTDVSLFHGEKLKLNWRTMFSDLFWRCMQDNRDVLELFLLELVLLGKVSVWKMCVISTIECSNIDFTFCVWNLGCPGHLVGDTTARCFYLSDSIKGWDSTKPPHRWPIVTRRTFTYVHAGLIFSMVFFQISAC